VAPQSLRAYGKQRFGPVLAAALLFQLKGRNIGAEPADEPEYFVRDFENCELTVNELFCELFPALDRNGGQTRKYFYSSEEE
jgi:hypothetical protein